MRHDRPVAYSTNRCMMLREQRNEGSHVAVRARSADFARVRGDHAVKPPWMSGPSPRGRLYNWSRRSPRFQRLTATA